MTGIPGWLLGGATRGADSGIVDAAPLARMGVFDEAPRRFASGAWAVIIGQTPVTGAAGLRAGLLHEAGAGSMGRMR